MIVGVTSPPWALLLARHDSLVDILFLRRMDAHQGLDRLDEPRSGSFFGGASR